MIEIRAVQPSDRAEGQPFGRCVTPEDWTMSDSVWLLAVAESGETMGTTETGEALALFDTLGPTRGAAYVLNVTGRGF